MNRIVGLDMRGVIGGLVFIFVARSEIFAQNIDSLQCDAWIRTLASGDAARNGSEILYRVDGCERPLSVVTAARVAGTRALIDRDDAGAAALYLNYLNRDSIWVADSYVPFVLPVITDKARSATMRGNLMFGLAHRLQPGDMPVGNVFIAPPGGAEGREAEGARKLCR